MAFIYGEVNWCKSANGTADNIYQVRLGYQLNSYDEESGVANITLRLESRSTSSSYITYGYNQTPTIDGVTLSPRTFDYRNTNVWQNFGERTFDVYYDDDGNYNVTKEGSFTTNLTGGRVKSGNASVYVSLPPISRQTLRIRINNEWKRATPYVRVNNEWKKAKAYVRVNNEWKKGG